MTPVRCVLLDADGVVQTNTPGWRDSVASLSGSDEGAESFLKALFAAERPCLTGEGDFSEALSRVLARFRSPASPEDALALWTRIAPCDDILGIVDALRGAGVRVGLATNQQSFRAAHMTHALGYAERFDDLFFSCHLGHAKPDSAFFGALLDALGAQGHEVLFVDDHPVNVAAARESGFNAEVYDLATGVGGMRTLLARHGLAGALA